MKRNPLYEAGFTRAVDHEEPEDLVTEQERKARLRKIVIVGAVLVTILVGIGVFATRGGESPAEQGARGQQLAAGNAHQAAIVAFKRSLLDDPNQPSVRFLLAQEYMLTGDPKAAEIEYRKALDLRFEPERTTPLLAASLVAQERYEKVVALVNGASLETPAANADLQAMLGTAYFALGQEAEAHGAWKNALAFVPSHPGALLAEAKALAARGDFGPASALLDRIPPTAPKQNDVLAMRGDIARASGKLADAATAYEAGVAREPGNLPLRITLAQTLVDLGRFDDAKRQVDAIVAAVPNHPKAQYIGALAALGKKDYRAAGEAITQALQQAPKDAKAHLLAGTIAVELGRPEDAELHLREAVALQPKDGDARRALAAFYVNLHETTLADEAIGPLFASSPDDPRVSDVVARIALLQGDATRAAKAYDRVDATRPEHVGASLKAASLKFAAGDHAGGLARLRAVAGVAPDDPDVDAALVAAFVQARQPKEALDAWNALARKQPNAARTWDVLATLDLLRGDRAATRRSFEKAAALDPQDFAAVGGLAKLDVDERKVDEARDRLRQYLVGRPGDPDATMLLVRIESDIGGRDDAVLALLRDARKADPRSSRIAQALATWFLDHGDAQQALNSADEGLAFAPGDPPLLEVAGAAALASGNAPRATKIYKTLTTLNAQSADYPSRLGMAWLSAGDSESALAAFRLVIARQPDRVDLQRAMIDTLLANGKADEASRLLFEMNRLAPKSPALPELDADVKLARRQVPEAVAAYRRALDATPTSELVVRTAAALTKARQPVEADAVLVGWLKTHPTDEVVRGFDAELALRSKDFVRAGDDYRALLRMRPKDPELLRKLASVEAQASGSQGAEVPTTRTVSTGK